MALAEHGQVHGDDERRAARGAGALDEATDEVAVSDNIELKPEGLLGGSGDLLNRADGHGGEGEGDSEIARGAGSKDFACGVLHAQHADGRERGGDGGVAAKKVAIGLHV